MVEQGNTIATEEAMNNDEIQHAIAFINDSWPQKPLGAGTQKVWGSQLAEFDNAAVMHVLVHLARTSEWRPSLATILKELNKARNVGKVGSAEVHDAKVLGPGDDRVSSEKVSGLVGDLLGRLERNR